MPEQPKYLQESGPERLGRLIVDGFFMLGGAGIFGLGCYLIFTMESAGDVALGALMCLTGGVVFSVRRR